MGYVSLRQIRAAMAPPRRADQVEDDAERIGYEPGLKQCTATWIDCERLAYGEEMRFTLRHDEPSVRIGDRVVCWPSFAARFEKPQSDDLTACKRVPGTAMPDPSSNDAARFRTLVEGWTGTRLMVCGAPERAGTTAPHPLRKRNGSGKKIVDEWDRLSDDEVRQRLEYEVEFDYFWNSAGSVVARFSTKTFNVLELESKAAKDSEVGTLWGLCDDPLGCIDKLLKTREVEMLLSAAKRRTIRVQPRNVPYRQIPDEVAMESNSWMHCAIMQALAGRAREESEREDDPITRRVEVLFKDHLHRLSKRIWDQEKRASGSRDSLTEENS